MGGCSGGRRPSTVWHTVREVAGGEGRMALGGWASRAAVAAGSCEQRGQSGTL